MKLRLFIIAVISVSLSLCSCSDRDTVRDGTPETVFGETVFLPAEKGGEIKVSMQMDGDWQLTSDIAWAAIYPMSGGPGKATLTFRTTRANTEVRENVAVFKIEDGGVEKSYYLVQEGRPGVEPASRVCAYDGAEDGVLYVEVWANAEFSASVNASWAEPGDIRYDLDSVLLEDGVHYSALRKALVEVDMSAYNGTATEIAELLLSCGEYTDTVRLFRSFVDWENHFYRKSVLLNFTGQGCSWCPYMTDGIYSALEQNPGRIEVMKLYGYGDQEELYSKSATVFDEFFSEKFSSGAPYSVFNMLVGVESHGERVEELASKLLALSDEAVAQYPSRSGIYAESEYKDGTLTVSGFVVAEEADSCLLSVFVREDGITASQAGRGNDYEHNFVLRASVTDELGDRLAFQDNVAAFHLTYNLPESMLYDADNASVLIYAAYPETSAASGQVDGVKYIDFGMTIDNAVSLPLNGNVDIIYEQ